MSFKTSVEFTCDAANCENTAQLITELKITQDYDTDSYGSRTDYAYLSTKDVPKGWDEQILFGTIYHYCPEHLKHR